MAVIEAILLAVLTIGSILVVVTLVGHGIWLLIVKLLGPPGEPSDKHAPRGYQLQADRNATMRQLDRLRQGGLIDTETYRAMRRALEPPPPAIPAKVEPTPPQQPDPLSRYMASLDATISEAASDRHEQTPAVTDKAAVQEPVSEEVVTPSAAVDAEPTPPDPPEPPEPTAPEPIATARPSRQILASFMQEKNIRWGELIGAMLILFSSTALVVSLWSEIEAVPVLKFFIFTAVTAGLFGVGLYTEHRWKLPSTSRGLLTLSMLLVPLNFLAIAAFSRGAEDSDPVVLIGEAAALLIFGALVLLAGRVIVPAWSILLTASLLGVCLCQLLIRRFADEQSGLAGLTVLATLLLACYAAPAVVIAMRGRRWRAISATRGQGVLTVLGIVSFATAMGLGLLIYVAGTREGFLHQLAPILCLYGAPALFTGLLLWRRVKAQQLAILHTVGTSVAIVGALVTLAGVAMAWRLPWALLVTGVLAGVVLTVAALSFRIAALHVAAVASFLMAYLTAWHVAAKRVAWEGGNSLFNVFVSGESDVALLPWSMLLAVVAAAFYKLKRNDDALWYRRIATATAAASLLLVTLYGFGRAHDPHGATMWVYAVYAAAALLWAHLSGRRSQAIFGALLMLAALVQALVFHYKIDLAWPRAMLAHATLATLIGLAWQQTSSATATSTNNDRTSALLTLAKRTSECAAVLLLLAPTFNWPSYSWSSALWLAVVWFVLAIATNSARRFTGGQIVLTIATVWIVARPWFAEHDTWRHPWYVQRLAIAMALLSLLWIGVRFALRRLHAKESTRLWVIHMQRLCLGRRGVDVDRIMIFVATALAVLLATWGAARGISFELSVYKPHAVPASSLSALALEWGSWLLLSVLSVVFFADLWQRPTRWPVLGVVLLGCTACLLIAGRWSDQGAAASMFRWSSAALLLLGSIPLWWRYRVGEVVVQWRGSHVQAALSGIAQQVMALLGSLTIIPLLLLTMIAAAWWSGASAQAGFFQQIGLAASYTLPLMLAAMVMLGHAVRDKARGYLYFMTLLINVAASIWWIVHWQQPPELSRITGTAAVVQFAQINVIALAVAGLLAVAVEGRLWRWKIPLAGAKAPHQVVAMLALGVLTMATAIALWADALGRPLAGSALPACSALLALTALLVACLWDARAAWALPALYAVGLIAVGVLLDRFNLSRHWLFWWATLAMAGYAILTSGLWASRDKWLPAIAKLRLPLPPVPADPSVEHRPWLVRANVSITVIIAIVAFWSVRTLSGNALGTGDTTALLMRLASASAVLVGALALAMLTRGVLRSALRPTALALGVVSAITFGLAWVTPQGSADTTVLLAVITMCILSAATTAYAIGFVKLLPAEQPWRIAAKWLVPYLFVAGLLSVLTVFGAELNQYETPGRVDLAWLAMLAVMAALVGLTLSHALCERSRLCLWATMPLVNAAVMVWWMVYWGDASNLKLVAAAVECLNLNVIAVSAAGVLALILEARLWRWEQNRPDIVAPHRVAAIAGVFALGIVVVVSLFADALGKPLVGTATLAWWALPSATVLTIACLWDARAKWALPALYTLGMLAIGLILDRFDQTQRWLLWYIALTTAGYALLTSGLWATRAKWLPWTAKLRLPKHTDSSAAHPGAWLVWTNLSVAVLIAIVAYWVVRTFSGTALDAQETTALLMRLAGAAAVLVAALAVALLARGVARSDLRPATLILTSVSVLIFALAWITPNSTADTRINLTVITMSILAVVSSAYSLGLVKFMPAAQPWHIAAKRVLPYLFAATVSALLAVMVTELSRFFFSDGVNMPRPAILATIAVLLGLTAIMLVFAMASGADPLNLSLRGRMAYVYAAEVLVGLLALHIRLTMPWLFHGFFTQYWPLLVMAVAFLGVGLSEWFGRQGRIVLAKPLERTGIFLPLLPVFGFWAVGSKVDYAGLLIIVGMLYAAISLLRASFVFGLLAALAANAALWSLLHDSVEFGLLDHPQLWMIPPTLSVLAAAHLNRKRLTPQRIAAIRYACLMVIYISSTADIMIQGIADSPWLPLVLMTLSVLGVMFGIAFRLRSYLYLGTAFLMLSLLTMIRFAALNLGWTWLWYVAGIVLGLAIIAVFALFEKHRGKALHMIEELKAWQQ